MLDDTKSASLLALLSVFPQQDLSARSAKKYVDGVNAACKQETETFFVHDKVRLSHLCDRGVAQ